MPFHFSRGLCFLYLLSLLTAASQPLAVGGSSNLPDVTHTGEGLEAHQNGNPSRRLSFPGGSGRTTKPLLNAECLQAGHGNSVLRLNPQSGRVLDRFIVSGPVERLARLAHQPETSKVARRGRVASNDTPLAVRA